ncbi:MAG: hypothetical protein ACE5DX_04390 [Candidatus Dojkabacteria bacterium]
MLTLILKHLSKQHKELREYIKIQVSKEVRESEAVIRADLWKLEQKLRAPRHAEECETPCHKPD